MAKILLHAGMPKAGSTAVQDFLRQSSDRLVSRGFAIAVASRSQHGPLPVELREYDGGGITSGELVRFMLQNPDMKPAMMRSVVDGLERLARDSQTVVLTTEGLTQFLWRADPEVLRPLDELARSHVVRVAYYVRPQHTALEATWRQWGFRTGQRPATYIEQRADQLHYLDTQSSIRAIAPHIDFVIRPFRSDLLDRGDIVADFARHFLGLDIDSVPSSSDRRANVGLPLELINILSCAPMGFLGPTPHYNRKFSIVKSLLNGMEDTPSERVQCGRRLLQGWCHERFEQSNCQLIRQLEWPTDSFVPPTGEPADDLHALNALWRPSASPMEQSAFLRLLDLQLTREENRLRRHARASARSASS